MADEVKRGSDIVLMTSKPIEQVEQSAGEERWVGRDLDGRYRIVRVLGRGGMGVVLLARQTTIDRTVVVKVLSRRLMDDGVARVRFEREAQSLSKLQHPNIVTMHDFGYDDGVPFIVMEYVEGETLARVMQKRRRLRMRRFFPLAVQILAAIGAAHKQGWVHRDLKPDNIMITPREGQPDFVKVLDFGLARMLTSEDDITKQNLMGTALYLSPEQIQGHKLDQRSDVYALGILFYLLLSGRRPFKSRDDVNLMFQHLSAQAEPLGEVLSEGHDVPEAVIALIHRCLEKKPQQRPRDASEVLRILIEAAKQTAGTPQLLLEWTPPSGDQADVSAALTEELTEIGPLDLRFLAASFDASIDVDDNGSAAFDTLFANTGELRPSQMSFDHPWSTGQHRSIDRPVPIDQMAPETGDLVAPPSQVRVAGPGRSPSPTVGVFYQPRLVTYGVDDDAERNRTRATFALIVVLVLLTIGVGVVAWISAPSSAADRVAAAHEVLDRADAMTAQGRFGEVTQLLDSLERQSLEHPDLLMRAASTREKARIGRLKGEARRLEAQGDLKGAAALYREILSRGGDDPEVKDALDRLQAPPAQAPPKDEPSPNNLDFSPEEANEQGAIPAEEAAEPPLGQKADRRKAARAARASKTEAPPILPDDDDTLPDKPVREVWKPASEKARQGGGAAKKDENLNKDKTIRIID